MRDELGMRGQMSFMIKPFTLVMIIVLLLFLVIYLNSSEVKKETAKRSIDLQSAATDILLLLANSEDCLAFQTPQTSSAYANIVDVGRLEEFANEYQGIEPPCARNYDYGFRVEITETVMSEKGYLDGNTWSFGVEDISREYHDISLSYWMPVALKYSEKEVGVGKMKVTLVDGDLEKVAGFLDRACMLGKTGRLNETSAEITISHPILYSEGLLCVGLKNKDCRRTVCDLEFAGTKSGGKYRFMTAFHSPDKLVVET
ncbi:MAG: hypothetical protein ACP5E4_03775 [Candidatus Aenigmatarchaeota archaeon]